MRELKCEYCGAIVRPWDDRDEKYLKEHPLAANQWIEELMSEHYETCPEVSDPDSVGGMDSGILERVS